MCRSTRVRVCQRTRTSPPGRSPDDHIRTRSDRVAFCLAEPRRSTCYPVVARCRVWPGRGRAWCSSRRLTWGGCCEEKGCIFCRGHGGRCGDGACRVWRIEQEQLVVNVLQ